MNSSEKLNGRRIVFCLSSIGGGGAERVASLLCNHWAEQGASVLIVATSSLQSNNGYYLHEDIDVVHLADRVAGGRSKLKRILALRRIFKSYKPNAIISFITDVNIASIIASFGIRCPVHVSERSFPPARIKDTGRLYSLLRKWLYRFAATVVAQTSEAGAWLSKNCPSSSVIVVPNPVSYPLSGAHTLDPRNSELIKGRRVILSSGRLVSSKRHDVSIRALAQLPPVFSDTALVVLGDGPERSKLEDLCSQLGVENRVVFLGHVDNPGAWYARADIFVFPSSFEGFPNAVMEAMSYGLPVVCFDILAGPRQLICDGENGTILPDDNHVERMTLAIGELLADSEKRAAISEKATEIRSAFSIELISEKWLQILYAQ